MRVIEKDVTAVFDVDETLVLWVPHGTVPSKKAIPIDYYGSPQYVVPHEPHVQLLLANLKRGRNIVIWSQNGYEWASNVAVALGLSDKDITIMAKPSMYVDDLLCQEWIGPRVYLKFDGALTDAKDE